MYTNAIQHTTMYTNDTHTHTHTHTHSPTHSLTQTHTHTHTLSLCARACVNCMSVQMCISSIVHVHLSAYIYQREKERKRERENALCPKGEARDEPGMHEAHAAHMLVSFLWPKCQIKKKNTEGVDYKFDIFLGVGRAHSELDAAGYRCIHQLFFFSQRAH
jgi:hypothetical protein